MPTLPVNSQHDYALQNTTTGAIDYLQFTGPTLTKSFAVDYGIQGFNVAASGQFDGAGGQDILAQNATTGQLDFLYLNTTGNLVGSATNSTFVGTVHGAGNFGGNFAGQTGPTVVSQLADGSIDLIGFNSAGKIVGSQVIAGTAGLPTIVGVGESNATFPMLKGVGSAPNDSIVVQYADGTIDVLGFSGVLTGNGGVTFTNSFVIPGSAGSGKVVAINQDFGASANLNALDGNTGAETIQFVTQSADGHITNLFVNSGYGGGNQAATEGQIFAQDSFAQAFPGYNVVDAGKVPHSSFFPIT